MACSALHSLPSVSNSAGGAGFSGVRVEYHGAVGEFAERTRRGVRGAGDRDPALGRAEPVDDPAAEPLGESGDIRFGAFVAVHDAQWVVGVVRADRGGEHVGQRTANVVGVRGAEGAHIGEEAGRGEPAAEREGGTGREAHRPAGHDRVGMEHRHGEVHGVRCGQTEPVGQHPAGKRDLAVGTAHRLGVTAGARGEDQHQQIVGRGRHRARRVARVPVHQVPPGGGVQVDDAIGGQTEVEAGERAGVPGLGEDELAVGEPDVPGQCGAAPGGVQADQYGAGQCGTAKGERELRHVVGQHADVERDSGPAEFGHGRRVGRRRPDMLGPGPDRVLEPQAGVVVGGPGQQQVGDGRHAREGHVWECGRYG